MSRLVIVPTGTANTASVLAAFSRLGAHPAVSGNVSDIVQADRVVLPGVGTFGAAAAAIDRQGVRGALVDRMRDGRATLAICVGMQLLAEVSSESPGVEGLGLIAEQVSRFGNGAKTPQLGWNLVSPASGCRFIEPGWAYFANSYRLASIPGGWVGATTDHRGAFVSALERGDILACQFHPELSGSWGARVLTRWLTMSQVVS